MEQITKYEKARIVGARALQLSMGAPMFIKLSKKDLDSITYSTVEIAKKELDKDLIPISVRRPLPEKIEKEGLFNVEEAEETDEAEEAQEEVEDLGVEE
tara:strand:- start:835 stop:1131 length:297 start_codon:yes stop_codon:yes gene_type:complete